MEETNRIKNFLDFIHRVEITADMNSFIMLFRGQNLDSPLLPSIARENPFNDTKKQEMEMLNELKRRAFSAIDSNKLKDNWEWLVYAQHFGLKTRLLDWTTNPLVALFFACMDYKECDSVVYLFIADKNMLKKSIDKSPFSIVSTKILKPPQNNVRIVAQSGWFTVHTYSKENKKFISLNTNKRTKTRIKKYIIPKNLKEDFMTKLDKFGINYQTMFPDAGGLCEQINWEYEQ